MLRFALCHYFYDRLRLLYAKYSRFVLRWNVFQMCSWHVWFKTWLSVCLVLCVGLGWSFWRLSKSNESDWHFDFSAFARRTEPSFISLRFCLFLSSLLCFYAQTLSGTWCCGVGHKGRHSLNTLGIIVTCKPHRGACKPDNQIFLSDLSWLNSNLWPLRTTETQNTCSGFCGFFA